jgi:uncharacterized protein YbaR (Trm112 family)
MNKKVTEQNQQELLEILALAKDGENKLKVISEKATILTEKCQDWYFSRDRKKEP